MTDATDATDAPLPPLLPESEGDGRPHATFGHRLAIAFASVAAITVILVAALISAVWNYQFDQYLRDNLQRIADGIATVSQQAYPLYGGWTMETLSTIPRFGPTAGVAVQIVNADGDLIYDDTTNYREDTSEDTEANDQIVITPEGPVVTSPITVNGTRVGTVHVWAYGSGAVLTERDARFRTGSLTALGIAGLVAVVVASLSGLLYSRRLVKPINTITAAAAAMRSGDTDARTGFDGDDEISVLGKTFDEMANAIEADRQLERQLTADVAHELRTPLQAIQAMVEAMQDGVLPADEERLGIVRDETVRLARLADAILELTRLERGSLPFEMQHLDPAVPVRAAVDALQALVEAKDLTLETDITHDLMVIGDPDRLQQAVGNLLGNAARYTPSGGGVMVSLRAENGCAVIEVADTGVGIAEEDLPNVFNRFWRADYARASSTGGLGIGLAVTKEIVERHHGDIVAEQREGGGTVFRIRLPLV